MDSFSLIGFLPDNMLIWIQFGTRYFIDYIYLVIGIPLLVDFLIVWSPNLGLSFGPNNGEEEKEGGESEANIINTVNLDEKFKFMYVYARNPNLFQSKDSVEKFDDEISKMKKSYAPGAGASGVAGGSDKKGSAANKARAARKKNVSYSFTDRLLKNGLTTLHLSFIAVVILVNAVGYFHYSSLFDTYFKLGERGYVMNFSAFENANTETKEEILMMRVKVDHINEVKYPEK